jgi:hypothetical protein
MLARPSHVAASRDASEMRHANSPEMLARPSHVAARHRRGANEVRLLLLCDPVRENNHAAVSLWARPRWARPA